MALWTDVAATPAAGIEGLLVDAPTDGVTSHVAATAVRAGFFAAYGADRLTVRRTVQPIPAAAVADADAIAVDLASGVAAAAYTAAADLDGVIGITGIYPAQAVTMTFDADAGHDGPLGFVEHEVWGEDANGNEISERLVRNNNGGAAIVTLTTRNCYRRVRQVDIGASNAATGLIDVGVDPTRIEFGTVDHPGIALYDVAREPSAVVAVTFDANETLSCVREGVVWAVATDAVVPGEPVYVRHTAGGGVVVGALYGEQAMPAGAAFGRLLGARWLTAAAGGGLALLRIGG